MVDTLDAGLLHERLVAARGRYHAGDLHGALADYEQLRATLAGGYADHPELSSLRSCHVRVLVGLAAARFETSGDLAAARTLLEEAEQVAVATGTEELVATVRGQRGLLLLRAGRPEAALTAFDDAVALIDSATPYDQTMMLLNRAVLHLDRGSVVAAGDDLERCVTLAADHGERDLEMRARHNLGWAEFLRGRIPRALADMAAAAALSEEPHPIAMLDRARTLREAGLLGEAERLLADAEALFERGGCEQDVAETQLARAETGLASGAPERALGFARAAEQTFGRRGNQRWRRRAQLLVLRCRSRMDASSTDLAQLADEAADLATACRQEDRLDLVRPAELLALECGLRAGAATVSDPPTVRPGDSLETRLQVREVRCLAAAAAGEVARAAGEVRHGLAELGAYQSSFGSLDLRTAAAVHGRPLARLGLDLAEQGGSPAALFAAIEQGRAISSRLAGVAPPGDDRTATLLTELRRTQEQLREVSGDAAAADQLRALQARTARLQNEIRARAWELEGRTSSRARASARISAVRREASRRGSCFVSFVLHHGRWRAVVATGRDPRVVDLAEGGTVEELVQRVRADLDALAMPRLPEPLAVAVETSLDTGLARLDELLLAPLELPPQSLAISCSSALAVLPWSLLPSRRGLPVEVAPGASAWLRAAAGARPERPAVVVVGGPGLHRAAHEAQLVGTSWAGSRLLSGEQATTTAVATALEDADLVHVAAHGTHQPESPLFSALRLADGPLYAYELDARERTAGCVVLSACEAGLSTVRPGDEGLGLTNVLLHLGTRSVLAGVARVRDDVAAAVMARVHRLMTGGLDSAQALATALADQEHRAPFVAFGGTW